MREAYTKPELALQAREAVGNLANLLGEGLKAIQHGMKAVQYGVKAVEHASGHQGINAATSEQLRHLDDFRLGR